MFEVRSPAREERPRDAQDLIDRHAWPEAAVLAHMRCPAAYLNAGAFVGK